MSSTLILDSLRFVGAIVKNANVAADAAIDADKMGHYYCPVSNFDLAIGATPVAREEIIHIVGAAGTIESFVAGLNETGTTTDVDFDLKKNGVSILSAVVNVAHADADKTVKSGTISSATVAAGDILSVELIVTSSTGAQGPFACVRIKENAAP